MAKDIYKVSLIGPKLKTVVYFEMNISQANLLNKLSKSLNERSQGFEMPRMSVELESL